MCAAGLSEKVASSGYSGHGTSLPTALSADSWFADCAVCEDCADYEDCADCEDFAAKWRQIASCIF